MIAALLLAVSVASLAQAQDAAMPARQAETRHEAGENKARTVPGGASKGVKACHGDIERFCKGVVLGEGRLGACLAANAKKLSKRCRLWAAHGGKSHVEEALARDIDGAAPAAPVAQPDKQ